MNYFFKFLLSILLSAAAFPVFGSSGCKPVERVGAQGVVLSDLKRCDEYAKILCRTILRTVRNTIVAIN